MLIRNRQMVSRLREQEIKENRNFENLGKRLSITVTVNLTSADDVVCKGSKEIDGVP